MIVLKLNKQILNYEMKSIIEIMLYRITEKKMKNNKITE